MEKNKHKTQRKKQARTIRNFRKIHRITASILFVFFFVISVSGLILGWKKHSGDLILPKSYSGTSVDLSDWLPLDSLHTIAVGTLHDSVSINLSSEIDRIDVRKNKGMVKFTFANHYWEVQLDGASGRVLHIDKRYADFIENIHDGSVLDVYFKTDHQPFKVFYTSIMGLSLLLFTITGFWLWYGPKRLKKKRNRIR